MTSELFSESVFLWSFAWQSTVCIVAGLVCSFILRRRSARAYQVLFLAIMAAVVVPMMNIAVKHFELGLFAATPMARQTEVRDYRISSDYEVYEVMVPAELGPGTRKIEAGELPSVGRLEAVKFSWRRVILCGWVTTSLILIARLLVTFVFGIRLLVRAVPLRDEEIREVVRLAKAKIGLKRGVEVRSSERIVSPVIWCWAKKPVLLVPSKAGKDSEKVNWLCIFCHELAHIKRRDHISGLLAEMSACMLAWNPFIWWAKRRLAWLSERACDDWVVASGEQAEEYAESLLDLVPQRQVVFAPAVVSGKRGLAGRVRHILEDGCGNPQTGVRWALLVSVASVCIAAGIAFAQTRPVGTEPKRGENAEQAKAGRVVHFPKDRSLGELKIQDAGIKRQVETFYHWIDNANWYDNAEYLCEATGDVKVPAGKRLALLVAPDAWRDLSALKELRPDDLYMLQICGSFQDGTKPDSRCMEYIAHLTGLRELFLYRTNITNRGIKHITGMNSLERLAIGGRFNNLGFKSICQLKSLKGLYLGENGITNAGLKYLAGLTSLEELDLRAGYRGKDGRIHPSGVDDDGLVHLAKLPSLRYLTFWGNFTDAGLVHLKNIPSLRILKLHQLPITDAGLAHLSFLNGLENLSLYNTQVTDKGIAHLKKMHSLKKLNLGFTKVTDAGIADLAEIKSLEYLDWPCKVTDEALGYLAQLSNLKHLKTSMPDGGLEQLTKLKSLEELSIGGSGVTDEDMSHIAKLTNLKHLALFGCAITDEGLAKLTALKSLVELWLWEPKGVTISGLSCLNTMPNLTKLDTHGVIQDNSGLDISGLTKLEHLTIWTSHKEGMIRDEDLACLVNLKRLKWFQVSITDKKPMAAIGDKGMAYLAGLTNMERLTIGGSNLTDEGLKYLGNMKKLYLLHIIGGKLSDEGLHHLEVLKSLKILDIDAENNFSSGDLIRLRKKLPKLETLRVGEENTNYGGYLGSRAGAVKK